MDALTGAIVAAVVGWLSIVAAAHLPGDLPRRLRYVGAASIVLLGLAVLGAPVPAALPVVVLIVGGVIVSVLPRGAAAA